MRGLAVAAAVGLGLVLGGAGCVRHVHHHHSHDAASLERDHQDTHVVIVHERPEPKRHCWRHGRHWHCRR